MRSFTRSSKLEPPTDLLPAATVLWREIVAQVPADQFRPSDVPLLRTYCEVSLLAQQATAALLNGEQVDEDGRPSPWVGIAAQHARTLAQLGGKLRLCPSSRIRAESAALQATPAASKPWERDEEWSDDGLLAL